MQSPPWPFRVAPRRPQEVSRHDPNHLWMQKSDFCKNACFPEENNGFLRVGWPSCAVFFALRPPPRAIWTGISSCDPWETPLPHSTKNKKNVFSLFSSLFSLFSALFPLPSKPPEVPPGGGMAEKRVGPPLAASFGDLWRPLLGSLFSSFFSLRSSLFSLLSSLFSLSSWSCEASIP